MTEVSSPLEEAERLYRQKAWRKMIALLEPLSALHRDLARYSFLLGIAYLYCDDTGGAYSSLRRAQHIDFRDSETAMALAAVYLRRGESDKAVQQYIDIIDRSANAKKARKALEYVRKNPEKLERKRPGKKEIKILYPSPDKTLKPFLVLSAIILAAGLLFALSITGIRTMKNLKPEREGIADIVLSAEERNSPISNSGDFIFVLTQKEAVQAFDKAKSLFSQYRDEAAQVELNRILNSNASPQLKVKAEEMAFYVREPSFLTMPDKFTWKEIAEKPILYEGVGIIWKGKPANLMELPDNKGIIFDFLVGYHEEKKLDGIVSVNIAFQTKIDTEKPLEILARVRADKNKPVGFYLDCIAIHQ